MEKQAEEMKKQTDKIETLEKLLRDKNSVQSSDVRSKSDEEEVCTICMNSLSAQPKRRLSRCGHEFHVDCFSRYKGKVCPLCRSPLFEDFPPLS